jgi:hypothetical protein
MSRSIAIGPGRRLTWQDLQSIASHEGVVLECTVSTTDHAPTGISSMEELTAQVSQLSIDATCWTTEQTLAVLTVWALVECCRRH